MIGRKLASIIIMCFVIFSTVAVNHWVITTSALQVSQIYLVGHTVTSDAHGPVHGNIKQPLPSKSWCT